MKRKSGRLTRCIGTFVLTAAMVLGAMPQSCMASPKEFIWLGRDGKAKVETGFESATTTYGGIWWLASDQTDGGASEVEFDRVDPTLPKDTVSDEDVKHFGGISGTINLKSSSGITYDPTVYIGFYILGVEGEGTSPKAVDATDWGGISIAYELGISAKLQLGLDHAGDVALAYDNPGFNLPKTEEGERVVKSAAWSAFKAEGWGTGTRTSGTDVCSKLATIKLKVSGKPGTYKFKIYGIGSKDANLSGGYTVSFDTDGGSAVASQSVEKGKKATKPAAPTKSGATFAGWYADAALKTPFNFEAPITADTTVYAAWYGGTTPATYSVTFDTDGGSLVGAQNVREGKLAEKPADPTKSGFFFGGWYADAALTTPFNFASPITKDTTVYAKWNSTPTESVCYINFDSNGGSFVKGISVTKGSKATKPADPTKEGYVFGGWYKDEALSQAFDFSAPVTADQFLYAKWNEPAKDPGSGDKNSEEGVGTKSEDGTKITDTDGTVYATADKAAAGDIEKGSFVADEATGGKYQVTAVAKEGNKLTGGSVVFVKAYNTNAKTVDIGDTVTIAGAKFNVEEISADACKGNKNLTKVTIGKNVKKIGKDAFNGCTKLKTIIVKTTKLKKAKVGKNAFKNIHKKAKAKVPSKKFKAYKTIFKARGMKGKTQKVVKSK